MTRAAGDREPDIALDACRALYDRCEAFYRYWTKRYIQRQGPHPIGSLIHFSRAYLAWVMQLGNDGRPSRIRVVRHPAGRARHPDTLLNRPDLGRLASLTGPRDHSISTGALLTPAPPADQVEAVRIIRANTGNRTAVAHYLRLYRNSSLARSQWSLPSFSLR